MTIAVYLRFNEYKPNIQDLVSEPNIDDDNDDDDDDRRVTKSQQIQLQHFVDDGDDDLGVTKI